ncbi:MAG: hypothetical protein ACWGPS_07270 [Candidatus Promineifilaceae bacterium]
MGVTIPQPFDSHISGSLGSVGPVTIAGIPQPFAATVEGIPDTYHINIDKLPKIQLGIDPVTLHLDPIDMNMRIKEFPSIRAHLPADFTVGLSLFGLDLLAVRLCGEAQVITEPYHPNPCEECGPDRLPDKG